MTPEREAELFAKMDLMLELYRRLETDIRDLREDQRAHRVEMRAEMSALKTEFREDMSALRTELHDEMSALKTELRGDMSALRTELRGDMSALRTELRGDVATLRVALGDVGDRLSRVEGRIEEQSKFVQLMVAGRQPRKPAA